MTKAFIPEHLLYLAKYLYSKEFSKENFDLQCIYRTVVNRAYYATYLHAREWIFDNGSYNNLDSYSDGKSGYHKAIFLALNQLKQYKAGSKFNEFKLLREKADYKLVDIVSIDDAELALKLANDIFNLLKQ